MSTFLGRTSNPYDELWYLEYSIESGDLPLFLLNGAVLIYDYEFTNVFIKGLQKRRSTGETVYTSEGYALAIEVGNISKIQITNIDYDNKIPSELIDELVDVFNQSLAIHHYWYSAANYFFQADFQTDYRSVLDEPTEWYFDNFDGPFKNKNVPQTVKWSIAHPYSNPTWWGINVTLALLNVNKDIADGLISCSSALTDFLAETIESGYISDTTTHWNVNIDGTKNPNISLTWDNRIVDDLYEYSVEFKITTHKYDGLGYSSDGFPVNSFYLGRYGASDQPITFTWNDLYKKGANDIDSIANIEKLLKNFTSTLFGGGGAEVGIFMKASCIADGVMRESSTCYAYVSYNGDVTKKGVVPFTAGDSSYVTVTKQSTDDVYKDFPDSYDGDIDFTNYGASGISLMTKSYVMTTSRLKQFGNFLWNADITDNLKLLNNNRIENIISCKVFPFVVEGQSDTSIVLGNIDTGIMGAPIAENKNFVIDVGSFKIPKYYNNWLDYTGTTIGIFLPMCGFYSLDTESFMDKTMNVKYYIDILTGVCKVVLSSNGIPVQEFGGQIGFDIPLTAQNRSQTELEQLTSLSSAVNNVVSIKKASSPLSIVSNLSAAAKDFADFVAPKDYFNTCGSLSPTVNMMTTHDVFLVIERPIVQYPSNYNHTYGKPCNLTLTLNNCKGFTLCSNVDVSTVPCTSAEKDLIKSALERGVYL